MDTNGCDTYYDEARNEPAFSNSDEAHGWMDNWCARCIHDKDQHTDTPGPGCPLVTVALMGRRPIQWIDGPRDEHGRYSRTDQYHCTEFRDENDGPRPHPMPDPPGQLTLAPRETYEGVRMFVQPTPHDLGGEPAAVNTQPTELTEPIDCGMCLYGSDIGVPGYDDKGPAYTNPECPAHSPETVKALTIRQPWAGAIAHQSKRVENRTWKLPAAHHGARILIHAAAQPDKNAIVYGPHLDVYRAVIAVATLTGCHYDDGGDPCCSDWAMPNQYHWALADVVPLPEPIHGVRGQLGIWTPSEDLVNAALRQLSAAPASAPS